MVAHSVFQPEATKGRYFRLAVAFGESMSVTESNAFPS